MPTTPLICALLADAQLLLENRERALVGGDKLGADHWAGALRMCCRLLEWELVRERGRVPG